MLELTANATVGEWVAQRPSRARVFERLGIDYCCGGKRPLIDVCIDKNLSLDGVLHSIRDNDEEPAADDATDYMSMPLGRLADHIEQTHHGYLREELPRIAMMFTKVVRAHGQRHPEMVECSKVFDGFRAELESHMRSEEREIFPLIRALDGACAHGAAGERLSESIKRLESEHDAAGRALEQMRAGTHGYAPPAGACNTFRVLLSSLAELERNMHEHVHKENNVMFPRVLKMEAEAGLAGCAG